MPTYRLDPDLSPAEAGMDDTAVERIDPLGRDCGQFLMDEVFRPLAIPDIYVGLPDEEALEARVAWVEQAARPMTASQATGVVTAEAVAIAATAGATIRARVLPPEPPAEHPETPELSNPFNRPAVHQAVIPAGGGIASARALGKVYGALALGGALDGVRLLRRESIEEAIVPTNAEGEVDRILGLPIRWGTGWHTGGMDKGSNRRTFGHGGAGGQMGFADLDRGLAFAFTATGQRLPAEFTAWRTELQSLALLACKE